LSTLASGPSSNRILNYQIRLTNASGVPVSDGTKGIKLTIFSAASGGSQLFTACSVGASPTGTPEAVTVTFSGGTGSVLIGDSGLTCAAGSAVAIPDGLFNNTALYLGVTVESDSEMTPRKRIVAAGYALNADRLDDLETDADGDTAPYVPITNSSGLFALTGNPTTSAAVITANPAADTDELLIDLKDSNASRFSVDAEGDTTVGGVLAANGAGITTNDASFDLLNTTATTINFGGAATTMAIGAGGSGAGLIAIAGGSGDTGCTIDGATGNLTCSGAISGGSGSAYATKALDNLASVAINASLLPGTAGSIDLGSADKEWQDIYVSGAGYIYLGDTQDLSIHRNPANARMILTASSGVETSAGLTVAGTLALGTNSLTMTGSLGATGARVLKGWFTDLEVTNDIAGDITGNAGTVTGFAPASGSLTLAGADAVTFTTTDVTSLTLPTSGTLATTAVASLGSLGTVLTTLTGVLRADAGVLSVDANVTDLVDNLSYAALADGTAGNLITWGAAGAPALVATGTLGQVLTSAGAGAAPTFQTFSGANTALSNLASVAINLSLLPGTNDSIDLGDNTHRWANLWLGGETLHIGASTSAEAVISYTSATPDVLGFGVGTDDADIAFFTDDLYLDKSAGRIGIGTATPGAQVHIYGNQGIPDLMVEESSETYSAQIDLKNTARTWRIQGDSSPDRFNVQEVTTGFHAIGFAGGQTVDYPLYIDTTGFVGLGGELEPAAQVHVTSPAWEKMRFEKTDVTAATHLGSDLDSFDQSTNAYWTGSLWSKDDTAKGSLLYMQLFQSSVNIRHEWRVASAGASVDWTVAMVLDVMGNLGLGEDTTPDARFEVEHAPAYGADSNTVLVTLTTPIESASSYVHSGIFVDPTIGNATGGTSTVNLIATDAVTGDAQVALNAISIGALTGTNAVEYAVNVGAGWDSALYVNGSTIVNGTGSVTVPAGQTLTVTTTAGLSKTSGTGTFSWLTTGTASPFTVTMDSVQTTAAGAMPISVDGLTTGKGLVLESTATGFSSGTLLQLTKSGASGSAAFTGDIANIAYSHTFNSGTTDNTGNVLDVSRAITTATTGVRTVSGALATFSDTATQGASTTLTHTGSVLALSQGYAAASGAVIDITNAGTGYDIDGTSSAWYVTKAGAATFGSHLTLSNAGSASELRLLEPSAGGSEYTAFKAQAQAASLTYTLPAAYPAVSGYALTSTDAGVMSWAAAATSATAFFQGGNSFTAPAILGTDDAYSLAFETGGTTQMTLDTSGNLGLGTTAATNRRLDLNILEAGTASSTVFGGDFTATNTGVLTGTASDLTYGIYASAYDQEAHTTTGNIETYGGSFSANGSHGGVSYAYGASGYANNADENYGVAGTASDTTTTASTNYGGKFLAEDTGAMASGIQTNFGVYSSATESGPTAGTLNNYAGYFTSTVTDSGTPTSTGYGLWSSATGADTNWGLYVNAGNSYFGGRVGIGVSPNASRMLDITSSTASMTGVYASVSGSDSTGGNFATSGAGTSYGLKVSNSAASGLIQRAIRVDATATAGDNYGMDIHVSGGTTSNYGQYSIVTGAAGTNYAAWLSASGGTNNWGLYVNAGKGYFNDPVGIGTAPSTGSMLDISISDSSTTATALRGVVIDVTNSGSISTGTDYAYGLTVTADSQTTTGTSLTYGGRFYTYGDPGALSNAIGVYSKTGDADSNQAFKAEVTTSGATNNYGLYTEISGATNNYALYDAAYGSVSILNGDIWTANGNMGVGTAIVDSNARLHVYKTGDDAELFIQTTTTAATADQAELHLKSGTSYTSFYYRDSDKDFGIFHPRISDGTNVTKFRIDGSADEMYLMEKGGNVGIGTATASQAKLVVSGDIYATFATTDSYTNALCFDGSGASLIEDCVGSVSADYSELYPTAEGVTAGDIVVTGTQDVTMLDGQTFKQMIKSSRPYQDNLVGVVSNPDDRTDFNNIGFNVADADNPMPVALNGRVLVKVNGENGSIQPGDPLTTSSVPGVAMRSTQPGMIIGHALSSFSGVGQGTVMVFVRTGWYAGSTFGTDGASALVKGIMTFDKIAPANAVEPAKDSNTLSFAGSAWAGSSAQDLKISLANVVASADDYRLSVKNDVGEEVAYFGSNGDAAVRNRLRFGLADGSDAYLSYDASEGLAGGRLLTSAMGFGARGQGFAELMPSDDTLAVGELVMVDLDQVGKVRRAAADDAHPSSLLVGVVADRPAYLAGMDEVGQFPIAVSGRAKVRVTGPVSIGDQITMSATAGVGERTEEAAFVIGVALESYDQPDTGLITVFVRPGWFNGTTVAAASGSGSFGEITAPVDFKGQPLIGIGALEGLGGLWSISGDGVMVAKEVRADKVTAKEYTVSIDDAVQTTGEATVYAGMSEIRIENPAVKPNSRVFITFFANAEGSWWLSERVDGAFTVKLSKVASGDLPLEYLIVNVEDNRTPPSEPPAEETAPAEEAPAEEPTVPPEEVAPTSEPPAEETAPAEEAPEASL
jgi:hypothetical protein